jgi:Mg-chelatase subunit ChlD/lysophospholipase L1-like esterase
VTGRRIARSLAVLVTLAALLVGTSSALPRPAQAAPAALGSESPVMLVVDTSGSMADDDGTGQQKIAAARVGILEVLEQLPIDSALGLRTYPERRGSSCNSGTAVIPPAPRDPKKMSSEIHALTAEGDTPTAEALAAAADDLIGAGYDAATIILVSDGLSTCDDPCPVAAALSTRGIDVTVDTVGFQIDPKGAEQLDCIAKAAGGTYTDVTDSDALAATLAALNGPVVEVDVRSPDTFSPADSAALDVPVTITDIAKISVRDVRATIAFDPRASGGSPTVLRPVRLLGNLQPGGSTQLNWQAYPASVTNTGSLEFTVTVTGRGMLPVIERRTVRLTGELDIEAAGPLFRDARRVVVMGDSFSAGEGAGDRSGPAAYTAGGCHRTTNTYAYRLFAGSDATVSNIACSGAVTADLTARQGGRGVAPQLDQLDELGDVDLVLMTMGGNDVGFGAVVFNCLAGHNCYEPVACNVGRLFTDICKEPKIRSTPELWTKLLAATQTNLTEGYRKVLDTLDGNGAGKTPLVVLPYLNLLPSLPQLVCPGLPGYVTGEIELVRWLQNSLNTVVENAVATVAAERPGRIWFADDVVHAAEPDHTICDRDAWVNGLTIDNVRNKDMQELVHPKPEGYRAEAAALLRWSRTITDAVLRETPSRDDRTNAEKLIDGGADLAEKGIEGTVRWIHSWFSDEPLEFGDDESAAVHTGDTVALRGGGFGAGQTVVVGIASTPTALASTTADDEGRISVEVVVPDGLAAGRHELYAAGFAEDGTMLLLGRPVEVSGDLLLRTALALLLLVALTGAGLLLLRAGRRRTVPGNGDGRRPQ